MSALQRVVVIGVSIFLINTWASPAISLEPTIVSKQQLARELYELGYSDTEIALVRRNSTGSKLYVYPFSPTAPILIVEGGRVTKALRRFAEVAFLNDAEQFVAWTDDLRNGVAFLGGDRLNVPRFGTFDVDPGGRYFVLGAGRMQHGAGGEMLGLGGGSGVIGAVAQPNRILARPAIHPDRIFADQNVVYLTGWDDSGSLVCKRYEVRNDGLVSTSEQALAISDDTVTDMDPVGPRILIEKQKHFFGFPFAGVYLLDLNNNHQKRIGSAQGPGLFLQPGVLLELR